MSDFRKDKNTTEHYTNFHDLATAWGCKQVSKQTKDKNKLESQRKKFCERHKCRACKEPMTYSPYNMMICKNPACKGIKSERKDIEGNKVITYLASFELLDDKGAEIANNIFA